MSTNEEKMMYKHQCHLSSYVKMILIN